MRSEQTSIGAGAPPRGGRGGRRLALAGITMGALAAISGMHPASAAASASDDLRRAGLVDSPGIALVRYQVSALVQDTSTGKTYGDLVHAGQPVSAGAVGTGFFVSSDGYLVTAGHLAAPTDDAVKQEVLTQFFAEAISTGQCTACDPDPAIDAARNASFYALTSVTRQITVYTQDQDFAGGSVEGLTAELRVSSPFGARDTAVIKVTGSNYPVLPVGDSSKVQVQDPVSVIGYPGATFQFTDARSLTTPSITTGTVTAEKQSNGVNVFQSDATILHGNSGGPMINSAGEVIGIVSMGPSDTTNFLITSNDVKDLLRQAGADNRAGQIDQLWRDGLALYDGSHYRKAAEAFSQCLDLNRVQVGCRDYRTKATAAFPQDVPVAAGTAPATPLGGSSPGLAVLGGGLTILVALGAALILRGRRSAATAAPAAPGPGAPGSAWAAAEQLYRWALPVSEPTPSNGHHADLGVTLRANPAAAMAAWQPAAASVAVVARPDACPRCSTPRTGQPFCGGCGTPLS